MKLIEDITTWCLFHVLLLIIKFFVWYLNFENNVLMLISYFYPIVLEVCNFLICKSTSEPVFKGHLLVRTRDILSLFFWIILFKPVYNWHIYYFPLGDFYRQVSLFNNGWVYINTEVYSVVCSIVTKPLLLCCHAYYDLYVILTCLMHQTFL